MEQNHFLSKRSFRFKMFARKAYSAFNSIGQVVSIGCISGTTLFMMGGTMLAQGSKTAPRTQVKELDEIVVTASLAELTSDESLRTIEVIPVTEIEQAPVRSINDLLHYLAAVDVTQRGGHGVQTDLSVRGSSLDQVAVLLNGINLTNAQTGHYSLDFPINVSDIERIEVLFGPSALIFGASAFSGAINIITKKDITPKIFAQAEWGMHEYRSVEARGATTWGNTVNSLSISSKESDGYIANSDYNMYNLFWQSRLNLPKYNTIDLQLGYNDKKYGANTFYSPAYPNQYEDITSYLTTLKGSFGNTLKFTPTIYWSRHRDHYQLIRGAATGRNFHRGDTYGGNFTLSYNSHMGHFSLMSEIRKDEIMSTNLGKPMVNPHRKYTMYDARTNWNTGLEYSLKFDKYIASAGLLINHNSLQSGKYQFFPSISVGYLPVRNIKVYSSWSKSSRLPTFTDLYYNTPTHAAGNDLYPEKVQALELGVNYKNDFMSTHIAAFASWGRNMIDWVKDSPNDEKWRSLNHSKINTKGVEAGVRFNLNYFDNELCKDSYLKIDYSYLDQNIDAESLISLYSLNYLKHKLTFNLNHKIYKGLSAGWYFRFQDRNGSFVQYEDNAPARETAYPAFSLLDLKLNYEIKDLNLYVNLNNIYNTDYYDLGNIPQPGFWFIGGLNYTLKY